MNLSLDGELFEYYELVDICCGGGGVSLGASLGGMRPVACVDRDPSFKDVIEKTHGEGTFLLYDIPELAEDSRTAAETFAALLRPKISSDMLHIHVSMQCTEVSGLYRVRNDPDKRKEFDTNFIKKIAFYKLLFDILRPSTISFENVFTSKALFEQIDWLEFDPDPDGPDVMDCAGFGTPSRRKRVVIVRAMNSNGKLKRLQSEIHRRVLMAYGHGDYFAPSRDKYGCGLPSGLAFETIPRTQWSSVTAGYTNRGDELPINLLQPHTSASNNNTGRLNLHERQMTYKPADVLLLNGFPKEYLITDPEVSRTYLAMANKVSGLCVPPPVFRAIASAIVSTVSSKLTKNAVVFLQNDIAPKTYKYCDAAYCTQIPKYNHPDWTFLKVCEHHYREAMKYVDPAACVCSICREPAQSVEAAAAPREKEALKARMHATGLQFECERCLQSTCYACMYKNSLSAPAFLNGNCVYFCYRCQPKRLKLAM